MLTPFCDCEGFYGSRAPPLASQSHLGALFANALSEGQLANIAVSILVFTVT
jgi:hypothetical protein